MANEYSKISNCLLYRRQGDTVYITDHLTDKVYELGIHEAMFAKKLDGKTNPYEIETILTETEIEALLGGLEACDLLKHSNKMVVSGGTVLRTVWEPKWTFPLRVLAFFVNGILMLSWLPLLVFGFFLLKRNFSFFWGWILLGWHHFGNGCGAYLARIRTRLCRGDLWCERV